MIMQTESLVFYLPLHLPYTKTFTATIVECLQRFGYDAESRQKVMRANSSAKLSINPVFLRIREGEGSEKRRMGTAFLLLCSTYSASQILIPPTPTAIDYEQPLPVY